MLQRQRTRRPNIGVGVAASAGETKTKSVLWVHTVDGRTESIDLGDEEYARIWMERLRDPAFRDLISGLSVSHNGVTYSLPRPHNFRQVALTAEAVPVEGRNKGGERLLCYADEVRLAVMVHREQQAAVRISLSKPGRRRFDPDRR
jgi:hypothetical protein